MLPISIVLAQNIAGALMAVGLRRLAKSVPDAQFQVLAVVIGIMYACTLPIVLLGGGVYWSEFLAWWPHLLAVGITLTLNPLAFYMALRYMDAAMASLLATINIVIAILGAVWILGERLEVVQYIGAAVVVAAIAYGLSVKLSNEQRAYWLRGAWYTLLSGISLAISMIIEKYLLDRMAAPSFIVWGWGLQTFFAVLLALTVGRHLFRHVFHRRTVMPLLGTGAAKAGTAGAFVASLIVFKSLSLAIVLAGLRPIFVSLLGAILLKERQFLRRKIIASCIAGTGIVLLFW